MKQFLVVIFALLSICSAFAQNEAFEDPIYGTPNKSVKTRKMDKSSDAGMVLDKKNGVIYVHVSKNLNIKDKIYLVNHSPYMIEQAILALMVDSVATPIGSASNVGPGTRFELASYSNNRLKKLKGQTLAIKIKGIMNSESPSNPFAVFEEKEKESPLEVTYDFIVALSEDRHDLYITVTSGENSFDF